MALHSFLGVDILALWLFDPRTLAESRTFVLLAADDLYLFRFLILLL